MIRYPSIRIGEACDRWIKEQKNMYTMIFADVIVELRQYKVWVRFDDDGHTINGISTRNANIMRDDFDRYVRVTVEVFKLCKVKNYEDDTLLEQYSLKVQGYATELLNEWFSVSEEVIKDLLDISKMLRTSKRALTHLE